jgi:Ni/Co efflux regulator RcnB
MLKRLLIAAAAVASLAAPAVADAQSYRHGSHNRHGSYDRNHDRGGYDRNRVQNRGGERWNRSNRDWWRGRSDFRGYNGRRNGYYFAPGYGYYAVEPRYYGHRWNRGAYLPQSYRRYYVQDPYFYGVRPAPYGYRWVYVDNDLVLVSIATGLILDVLLDVY